MSSKTSFATAYAAVFGALVEGEKIFYKLKVIDSVNGQSTEVLQTNTIVQAGA